MPSLTYYGHANFLLSSQGGNLIIDPFFSGNPPAESFLDRLPHLDLIVLTHGHQDHVGDAIQLSEHHQVPILATFELAQLCESAGARVIPSNIGGSVATNVGKVRLVPAWHSSSFQTKNGPVYAGMPAGVVCELDGKTVYHLGDTALFSDLALVAKRTPVDVALLPIGGHFTMDPEDALLALDLIQPKLAIPMHVNTFDMISQNVQRFVEQAAQQDHTVRILSLGEHLEL